MMSFIKQSQCYAATHQDSTARLMNLIGAPLVLFSLLIFLGFIHIYVPRVIDIDCSEIAVLLLAIYYLRLQWALALFTLPILVLLVWIANLFSYQGPNAWGIWSFFIIGFIGVVTVIVGYFIEGKRPTLKDTLCQFVITPLIIVATILFRAGLMKNLKDEINLDEKKHN